MVGALHEMGLRVVLDAVFNHTSGAGLSRSPCSIASCPGYYPPAQSGRQHLHVHVLPERGNRTSDGQKLNGSTPASTGRAPTGWTASVSTDGPPSRDNLLAVRAGLDQLTPHRDGVDGASIWLYGRAGTSARWPTTPCSCRPARVSSAAPGSAVSVNRLRAAVRGGGRLDADPSRQGSAAASSPIRTVRAVNADAKRQFGHGHDLLRWTRRQPDRFSGFTDSTRNARRPGVDLDYTATRPASPISRTSGSTIPMPMK